MTPLCPYLEIKSLWTNLVGVRRHLSPEWCKLEVPVGFRWDVTHIEILIRGHWAWLLSGWLTVRLSLTLLNILGKILCNWSMCTKPWMDCSAQFFPFHHPEESCTMICLPCHSLKIFHESDGSGRCFYQQSWTSLGREKADRLDYSTVNLACKPFNSQWLTSNFSLPHPYIIQAN